MMVGQVGKDSYADALLENLADEGVNMEVISAICRAQQESR